MEIWYFRKNDSGIKGGRSYQIKFPIVDGVASEIAIEIHGGSGEILTEAGSRAQIGICGFMRKRLTEKTKNVEYRHGIAVSSVGDKIHRAPTSS